MTHPNNVTRIMLYGGGRLGVTDVHCPGMLSTVPFNPSPPLPNLHILIPPCPTHSSPLVLSPASTYNRQQVSELQLQGVGIVPFLVREFESRLSKVIPPMRVGPIPNFSADAGWD